MKVVILAGGLGTRLGEETELRPKPMVNVGDRPMIWHIMKIYAAAGLTDFIICLGYKGYVIKEFFANYFLHTSDVTFDIANNTIKVHRSEGEPWKVTLVDTGPDTMTGGRLKRIKPYLSPDQPFCMTYGDGVADIDIRKVIEYHRSHQKLATLLAVSPPGRFGSLVVSPDHFVHRFEEKPKGDGAHINGGFFVLDYKVLDYIEGDASVWEQEPMRSLGDEGQLMAYMHEGFWQCMDTLRDKRVLEDLWTTGRAPWKLW